MNLIFIEKKLKEEAKDFDQILKKMIKKIKIGLFNYKISFDDHVSLECVGEIYYNSLQIRLKRDSGHNKKIKKEKIYEILVHEIIHGINENIKFIKESKGDSEEECIDLIATYVIENIHKIQSLNADDFEKYIKEYEINIKRKRVTFSAIVKMLNDNPKLTNKLKKVFK